MSEEAIAVGFAISVLSIIVFVVFQWFYKEEE